MEYRQSRMLDHFTTGIFAAMDAKKQELLDAGRTVYNLSIGHRHTRFRAASSRA